MACEEEKLAEDTENNTHIEVGTPNSDTNLVEDEENRYERLEHSFRGNLNLKEDLFISAKRIYFRSGSRVKINQFKFILEAESIVFESGSSVVAYNENEYASCKTNGKNAGLVEVYAESISGNTLIDLAGQHAGQIGYYHDQRLSEPIHTSHKPIQRGSQTVYLGCQTYVRGYPKDVPDLFIPKVSGEPGALLIEAIDHSNFNPQVSNRRPHGSYAAIIEGRGKNVSWTREALKGPDGQSGEVCFKISGEYLCK